ncbi:Glycoside hydrolase family 1 protein [Mycena kentingensis (nom. inval.)]|nr:Glycoside hydrolase family 1 protein [Mycena kentingensis (nom. inval.)]
MNEYDQNFCFPIPPKIECDLVRLVPFVPSIHSEPFFAATKAHPELWNFLPFGPFSSADEFTSSLITDHIQPNKGSVLFAIFNKPPTGEPELSGTIGLLNTSPTNLCTELGFVVVLPAFQGTHVARRAAALLLRWVLSTPAQFPGGLALRRAAWQANAANTRSIRVAERMGFRREALLRWERTLPPGLGKEAFGNGAMLREGDPTPNRVSRHTVMLSCCWDDWEQGGVRDLVHKILSANPSSREQ